MQFLVDSPLFGHFVLRHYGTPKAAGQHYARVVKATCAQRAFGVKGLLKDGAKVQVVKLQASTQKQEAVEAIKNYLLAVKFQSRMAALIANSVDELLMNAMFDAPIDEIGKPLYSSTARSTLIKLEDRHAVEMHVGFDGDYIAISAVDLFGSLDKVKLLKHISKIYTEEEYRVRTAVAGAGIGLATVFRSGGSFFFVSENRVRTEVTVFFRRTENFREFPRSVSLPQHPVLLLTVMPSFPRIILASTSPRRIGMLKAIRLPFRAIAPDTDETAKRGERPRALVKRLAIEKAQSVTARVAQGKGTVIVIAADTIVVAPGGRQILGKPRDRAHALRMLRSLAGAHACRAYGLLRLSVGQAPDCAGGGFARDHAQAFG